MNTTTINESATTNSINDQVPRRGNLVRKLVTATVASSMLAIATLGVGSQSAEAAIQYKTPDANCVWNAMRVDPGLTRNQYWTNDPYSFSVYLQRWNGSAWKTVASRRNGLTQTGNVYVFNMLGRKTGYYRVKAGYAWNDHSTYPSKVTTWGVKTVRHYGPNKASGNYCYYRS